MGKHTSVDNSTPSQEAYSSSGARDHLLLLVGVYHRHDRSRRIARYSDWYDGLMVRVRVRVTLMLMLMATMLMPSRQAELDIPRAPVVAGFVG
jgi:hypothetical protein